VQVDELRALGSSVETIFPDSASEHLFGVNAMDVSRRPPAARAGYDQGRALAESSPGPGADALEVRRSSDVRSDGFHLLVALLVVVDVDQRSVLNASRKHDQSGIGPDGP